MRKGEMFLDEPSGKADYFDERHQITKKNVFISFCSIKYYKFRVNTLMVLE